MGLVSNLSVNASEIVAATLILEGRGRVFNWVNGGRKRSYTNRAAKRKLTPGKCAYSVNNLAVGIAEGLTKLLAKAKRHPRPFGAYAIVNGDSPTNLHGRRGPLPC